MKETILLYHIADQDRLHAIQRALLPLGMRIRMVQKEEYLQPVVRYMRELGVAAE